jgi:uncharacterized protein (UPF0276 family)
MSSRRDLPSGRIPATAGIGLRFPHHRQVAASPGAVAWVEVHPENYMAGGAALDLLETVRRDLPLSLHGVGLSLGSAGGIDTEHLRELALLVDRLEPGLVSDHLSWSVQGGAYLPDLLPLPYTEEALGLVCRHVEIVQEALRRPLLVENPSRYMRFRHTTLSEGEFLSALVARTGCRLLYDLNNLFVSARNLGEDPTAPLFSVPLGAVAEIHLAGHAVRRLPDGQEIRIDDHGAPIAGEVWALYRRFVAKAGPLPTLIEWDTNLPPLETLLGEAAAAQSVLDGLDLMERHVA